MFPGLFVRIPHVHVEAVNKRAGAQGVGFFHLIEDRVVGLKVRGIYENPAAHVLIEAHKKLEQLVPESERRATNHYGI